MRACFPVAHNRGMETSVYPHFGSAPMYLLVDTGAQTITELSPPRMESAQPCTILDGFAAEPLDAVVVSGIGPGALSRLRSARITVYHASTGTVGAALAAIARGTLPIVAGDEVPPPGLCGTLGHGRRQCDRGAGRPGATAGGTGPRRSPALR